MKTWETVAILGVGLIGGSIGLALRRRGLARKVVGIGRRTASLKVALERGAVTATTMELAQGVAEAELTVVCTPVGEIVNHVRQVALVCPSGALVTDVGSIKAAIVDPLDGTLPRGVRFVGSHPLAGSEKGGPGEASQTLFEGKTVVLTPTGQTSEADRRLLVEFWSNLGARVVIETAERHDQILAATSHLPHLLASALAAATPEEQLALTATGWADTTRIAAGDPELWQQILLGNREQVLAALARFESLLGQMRDVLSAGDASMLKAYLAQGKRHRDAAAN
jgi:prephenate dehydrogenase